MRNKITSILEQEQRRIIITPLMYMFENLRQIQTHNYIIHPLIQTWSYQYTSDTCVTTSSFNELTGDRAFRVKFFHSIIRNLVQKDMLNIWKYISIESISMEKLIKQNVSQRWKDLLNLVCKIFLFEYEVLNVTKTFNLVYYVGKLVSIVPTRKP